MRRDGPFVCSGAQPISARCGAGNGIQERFPAQGGQPLSLGLGHGTAALRTALLVLLQMLTQLAGFGRLNAGGDSTWRGARGGMRGGVQETAMAGAAKPCGFAAERWLASPYRPSCGVWPAGSSSIP
ncbi:hypothetical protein DIZ27_42500 [Streptomyces sp. NWU339]|nr:hypothetical protein DIZ27_42500 [Streptomyces sp. NWU339]